jgi:hypothetical protein
MLTDNGLIDYEGLVADAMRDAMRTVVRNVLTFVAKTGELPGDHHFYISFDVNAPGVVVSKRLKERYPSEMTVVLQHRFWDLIVHADRFEVKLAFNSVPERLVIPFAAIKVFVDPSARFGHQFEEPDALEEGQVPAARSMAEPAPTPSRKRAPRRRPLDTDAPSEPAAVSAADTHASGTSPPSGSLPALHTVTPAPPAADAASETKIVSLDKFRKK